MDDWHTQIPQFSKHYFKLATGNDKAVTFRGVSVIADDDIPTKPKFFKADGEEVRLNKDGTVRDESIIPSLVRVYQTRPRADYSALPFAQYLV